MSSQTHFSSRDLLKMLKDLGALAASQEGRQLIASRLQRSVRESSITGPLLNKVNLMYDFFRDPAEPLKPKLLIGAALLYLIIPNDLLPDFFPLFGFTDDFAAIAIAWSQVKDVLMNYELRRQQRQSEMEVS
jgi:uncharacterized membrane protein YkvA (DUF1232 family)